MSAACTVCKHTFEPRTAWQVYCSNRCAKRAHRTREYGVPPEPKTCKSCQADFTPTHKAHIFCTVPCRREYQKRELPSLTRQFGLTTGTVGALNELRVCVDLMQRGYHVFRSMSPSCPCDLMAWAPDGKMLAVEVKTGYELGNHISAVSTRNNTFDVLAVVLTERIVYTPALETLAISA